MLNMVFGIQNTFFWGRTGNAAMPERLTAGYGDSGKINIDKIRELAGHEDERTTFHNYCYNRETDARTHENIERALSRAKV